MEKMIRRDLIIAGTVSGAGGVYNTVKIHGEGTVDRDLDCVLFKCHGKSEIYGNVKAKTMQIHGVTVVKGNVQSDKVKIHGQADIDGNIVCKEIKCNGATYIEGSATCEELQIRGHLKTKGDCEAESFFIRGAFTIGGLLNAGTIDAHLYGGSQVKEIGGEKIMIRRKGALNYLNKIFKSMFHMNLTVETIEGDEIYLENTKAKVVRGTNVSIGPGCEIELVEYKNHFQQVKGAKVNESKKV